MVPSKAFTARLRAEQDEMEQSKTPKLADVLDEVRPKKMASGGLARDIAEGNTASQPVSRPDRGFGAVICKADGGEIEPLTEEEQDIASAIMAKRRAKMAEGGEVEMEDPNSFHEQNEKAALKENYEDSDTLVEDPEIDAKDVVSQIRRKMRSSIR